MHRILITQQITRAPGALTYKVARLIIHAFSKLLILPIYHIFPWNGFPLSGID